MIARRFRADWTSIDDAQQTKVCWHIFKKIHDRALRRRKKAFAIYFFSVSCLLIPYNGWARVGSWFILHIRSGVRKQLPVSVSRRRANRASRRSSSRSLACSTQARLLRFETLEDRRMLSADLVSKAAFPSFSAGGSTLSVLSANGRVCVRS